jgi:hypothetical protein
VRRSEAASAARRSSDMNLARSVDRFEDAPSSVLRGRPRSDPPRETGGRARAVRRVSGLRRARPCVWRPAATTSARGASRVEETFRGPEHRKGTTFAVKPTRPVDFHDRRPEDRSKIRFLR